MVAGVFLFGVIYIYGCSNSLIVGYYVLLSKKKNKAMIT